MEVWVLTRAFNDYDQHGDYFVAVFGHKPTEQELLKESVTLEAIPNLLNYGVGRIRDEYDWWYLEKHEVY